MKHLLRIISLNEAPQIEINAKEYNELEIARKILSNAQDIEVKYDIMITNYIEFEKQVLNNTATIMVRSNVDYLSSFEIRQSLNICLVNLLTSARLYIDQINQNVNACMPNITEPKNKVDEFFAKEYDENKEYRFMEALRNYVQHRGLPVHLTQYCLRWTTTGKRGQLEYILELSSDLSHLKTDPKFKKSVLKELDEKIDLKSATRRYVESISSVHESVRILIANSVSAARKLIEETHVRYSSVYNKNLASLGACKQTDEGYLDFVPLLLDWDNIRLELQKRNKKLTNLSKRYVTGVTRT